VALPALIAVRRLGRADLYRAVSHERGQAQARGVADLDAALVGARAAAEHRDPGSLGPVECGNGRYPPAVGTRSSETSMASSVPTVSITAPTPSGAAARTLSSKPSPHVTGMTPRIPGG